MYTEFHPDNGAEITGAGAYSLCFVTSGHKGPIIINVCQMTKKNIAPVSYLGIYLLYIF